jgi:cyclopropane fatty-acyl-phospholipid synthase-like methyltransferase
LPTKEDIVAFYDAFLPKLKVENARHHKIFKSLSGLPVGSTLDIGCGAGLTSRYLAGRGHRVTAIDISPRLIEYAQQHNSHENITYLCGGIGQFRPDKPFDCICLIDVLEHLDQESQRHLYEFIISSSHENTVVYINVPYAETTAYLRENKAHLLQPIDNKVPINSLLYNFGNMGFIPYEMQLYWHQYLEIFFCKKPRFRMVMDRLYQGA